MDSKGQAPGPPALVGFRLACHEVQNQVIETRMHRWVPRRWSNVGTEAPYQPANSSSQNQNCWLWTQYLHAAWQVRYFIPHRLMPRKDQYGSKVGVLRPMYGQIRDNPSASASQGPPAQCAAPPIAQGPLHSERQPSGLPPSESLETR